MKTVIVIVMGVVLASILCKCNKAEEDRPEYTKEYHCGHSYMIRTRNGVEQVMHDPGCSCNIKTRNYHQ